MANPFIAMSNTQAANSNESLPLFVEYGYNFEKQCFSIITEKAKPRW